MKRFALLILLTSSIVTLYAQNTLSIEECRKLAMEHNRSIMIAKEKANVATEIRKAAFTQFLPNFSANGTYLFNQKNISLMSEDALLPIGTKMADGSFGFRQDQVKNQWVQVSPGVYAPLDASGKPFDPKAEPGKIIWKDYALLPKEALEMDVKNVFAGAVGFVQPVFMGGKVRELYKMAKSGERLASIEQERAVDELIIDVDEAYWRVVSIENKKKLAQEYSLLMEKLVKNVGIMVEEGVATKGDVLKVSVKLNEAQMMLAKADNGLRLSKMALFQICGLEINSDYSLSESNLTGYNGINPVMPTDSLIENRAEIRALNEAKKIAGSNLKIMESRFMPNLILSGNYIVSNPNVYNGVSNSFAGMFSVGVGINIPIFHFGERVHTLHAAKSQVKIVQYQIDEAKEKIELQVNQFGFRTDEARRRLAMAEKSVEKAVENVRFANEAFDAGLIGSTDLMEAQTAWLMANSEKIDSKIEVKMCELYLKKAIGESLVK
jgi:outer membrane protein TolC